MLLFHMTFFELKWEPFDPYPAAWAPLLDTQEQALKVRWARVEMATWLTDPHITYMLKIIQQGSQRGCIDIVEIPPQRHIP